MYVRIDMNLDGLIANWDCSFRKALYKKACYVNGSDINELQSLHAEEWTT